MTADGFHDATRDVEQIGRWWTEHPDAQIGLATGATSGFVVVDLDVVELIGEVDGLEWARDVNLPDTLTATTPSGGEHRYYAAPGEPVPTSAGQVAPHVDIRGDGGYVILPPSRNGSGCWPGTTKGSSPSPSPSSSRGSAQSSSPWRSLDDEELDPALVAAVDELVARGGHHPVLRDRSDRDAWVEVTRPGKLAGVSAQVSATSGAAPSKCSRPTGPTCQLRRTASTSSSPRD